MAGMRRLVALVALTLALAGCPGGEQGPDGCPHADDERVTDSTCRHPASGGGWVYHSD